MNTAIDALIAQTNETALTNTAKGMIDVFDATLSSDLHPSEANAEMFSVIASDVVASVTILSATDQSGQPLTADNNLRISSDTAAMIVQIKQRMFDFGDLIAPAVSEDEEVATYLRQVATLNADLLSRSPDIFTSDQDLFKSFQAYQTLVDPLEMILGYNNYAASFERNDFWPNGDLFHGSHNYINLFRTSDTEKAKSVQFMAFFDGLPQNEQVAAYAWIYGADFETYLAVAALPSDLPPWITSKDLRALHRSVNDATMAEFEEKELEMLE